MTYWALNAVFLIPVLVTGAVALARISRTRRRLWLGSVALTAVALLLLTAVFDNVMIAAGLFSYNPDTISGLLVSRAPLEDFAYPLAAVVLLPSLWSLLAPGTPASRDDAP